MALARRPAALRRPAERSAACSAKAVSRRASSAWSASAECSAPERSSSWRAAVLAEEAGDAIEALGDEGEARGVLFERVAVGAESTTEVGGGGLEDRGEIGKHDSGGVAGGDGANGREGLPERRLIEGGQCAVGLLAEAGGGAEAGLFGAEGLILARQEGCLVDFADFEGEALDEALPFAGIGAEGVETAADVAQGADGCGERLACRFEAGESVERGELDRGSEDGELLGLAVEVEEALGEGADVFEASGGAIDSEG